MLMCVLFTFPSILLIRFHSHPAFLDKQKTPIPKLPSLSFFSTLPTNALQYGRAVYTYYVYDSIIKKKFAFENLNNKNLKNSQ